MPSWTRSWPAAANKACFSKQKPPRQSAGKRFCRGGFLFFSARCAVYAMLEQSLNAHPARPCGATAGHAQSRTPVQRETLCKTKTVFQSSTAGKRPPGCGSQHPFRTLSGAHALLAAAPTAPPCVPPFVAMRHLPPAGGSLWPQAAVVAVALAELGSQSCSADAGCRAPQFSGETQCKTKTALPKQSR